MKVYSVETNDGEAPLAFATKGEALAHARAAASELVGDHTVDVEEVVLVKIDKAAIVRLINVAGGYVESSRCVARFPWKPEPELPDGGAS